MPAKKKRKPKQKEVTLTVLEKQALRSAIQERIQAENRWKEKVELQTKVVDSILQGYGFSTKALMDLARLDFDGVVTITEAEEGSEEVS